MSRSFQNRGSRGQRSNYRGRNNNRSRGPAKQKIDPSRFIKKAVPATVESYVPKHTFADFALHDDLKAAVAQRGFTQPTAIQDQAIPLALERRDIIGIANTGTGKTAAFLLPALHSLIENPSHKALIIAPTRELALQIQDEFRAFTGKLKFYSTLCIGGTSIGKQIHQLKRNPHVVIGTPGRLKDLMERRVLNISSTRTFVLDEVDRMVDMGFINDIKHIAGQLPNERHNLFFSATSNQNVEYVMKQFVHEAHIIKAQTGATADNIEQNIVRIARDLNKIDALHSLLKQDSVGKTLVFGETKRGVERLAKELGTRGVRTVSIHGNKSQSQRQRALEQFRRNQATVMVATDVAARGLDIDDITHVINYDLPQTYDDYVHRIGRAGRAGKVGNALTFVA